MIYSRKITLALKLNPTMFQVVNQKSIGAFNTIFGPSIKAVLTLSSKTAEMASILPTIIGASADSRNVNFQDLVLKHLKNSTVEVPAQGYELETGWEFSLNDPVKRDAILDWAKKNSINTVLFSPIKNSITFNRIVKRKFPTSFKLITLSGNFNS